jgi:hypothetical protein
MLQRHISARLISYVFAEVKMNSTNLLERHESPFESAFQRLEGFLPSEDFQCTLE